MLKQFAVPLPKSVSRESAFIYPLNVSALDAHRIKRANGASSSTYWKSPYHGPDSKQLDIQFKHTELYNATIKEKIEAKEKSVKSILKNTLQPSSLEQRASEMSMKQERRKPDVGKPKYHLRQTASPSQSRSSGKKEKKVKFDDKYGRLSSLESKYRLMHSERKNNAKFKTERSRLRDDCCEPNSVDESLSRLQIETNSGSEQIEHEPDLRQVVSNSDQSSVFYLEEKEGFIENTRDDKKVEHKSSEREPKVIPGRLNYVDVTTENEAESAIQKKDSEMTFSFEETNDVFCEQVPLFCGVNIETPADTSGGHVSNKPSFVDISTLDTSGKRTKPLVKSKTAPDLLVTRHVNTSNDHNGRRASLDDSHSFSKIALGRRRISGKTTVNTLGGAVVTRSHVRPVMFSRLSRESSHVPALIESRQQSYRNFCDKSKTNQIVNWLENVKEIQSREGPCIQADSELEGNK